MVSKTGLKTILTRIKEYFYPPERSIYVVREGTFKGEWLVPVAFVPNHTIFFSLPDKHIRTIPNTEVEEGVNKNILDLVEILPKRVYNTCLAEYKLKLKQENDNALNRRQQHPTQGVLGSKQRRKTTSKLEGG
jgi:hypothetical protein